ncbi:hypothetical protein HDK64DRAFT_271299 [Phyllosticta capitalensis]
MHRSLHLKSWWTFILSTTSKELNAASTDLQELWAHLPHCASSTPSSPQASQPSLADHPFFSMMRIAYFNSIQMQSLHTDQVPKRVAHMSNISSTHCPLAP